jgi:uncharacterized protein (DUF2147 family)
MKRILTLAAAGWLSATPALAAERGVLGQWRTPDRGGLIEVSECGKGVCGKIMGGQSGNPLDVFNKDPALRTRKLIGTWLFRDMRANGATWKGRTYNPDDGGTYDVTLTLKSPALLNVTGCIVWPLCRGKDWTRVR